MQEKINFVNGQCFNFAYAICQMLKNSQCFSELYLAVAMGTRSHEYEDVEKVCIHCMAKVYNNNYFAYLDAQGLYFDSHLEKVVDIWQSIELELTGFLEEVKIVEYNFWDDYAIQSYWVDLEEAGAQKNSSVIQYAKQYIYDNSNLFQDVFIKI